MKITRYALSHPLLEPFIAGIYLLERHAQEAPERYLAFPNVHHFVTINQAVNCRIDDNKVAFTYQAGQNPSYLRIFNYGEPHLWSYEGPVQEWNICFRPLGINHFLDYEKAGPENAITHFNYFEDFAAHVHSLYQLSDRDDQVRQIENYWLSKLKGFRHPFLHELMKEILENNGQQLNFSDLALRFKVSRNTLHTAFKRHVGTSPGRFEKVLRFRHALAAHRLAGKSATLTHVSGEAAYFDQSHMVRDFRSFTGFTPKDFYKRISSVAQGEINWIVPD